MQRPHLGVSPLWAPEKDLCSVITLAASTPPTALLRALRKAAGEQYGLGTTAPHPLWPHLQHLILIGSGCGPCTMFVRHPQAILLHSQGCESLMVAKRSIT